MYISVRFVNVTLDIMNKLFFLSFLLCSASLQCMQEDNLMAERFIVKAPQFLIHYPDLTYAYFQENHALAINHLAKLEKYKTQTFKGHSFLSFATIAINAYPEHKHTYEDKKQFIQKLLNHGFQPTEKDRRLALIIEKKEGKSLPKGLSDLFD